MDLTGRLPCLATWILKMTPESLEGAALAILQAAEQAAPPSLALPRKGGGNAASDTASDLGEET